mgnify:CR=1 FL=1
MAAGASPEVALHAAYAAGATPEQAVAEAEKAGLDALRRIDRKTYGMCERCFQAIPKLRLEALPYAQLCVDCKNGGLSRR